MFTASKLIYVLLIKICYWKFLWAVSTSIIKYTPILDKANTDLMDLNHESATPIFLELKLTLSQTKQWQLLFHIFYLIFFSHSLPLLSYNQNPILKCLSAILLT